MLLDVERDLYVLMAELATLPENRHKLVAGVSLVTAEMVDEIGRRTDDLSGRFEMPKEFTVPAKAPRSSAWVRISSNPRPRRRKSLSWRIA